MMTMKRTVALITTVVIASAAAACAGDADAPADDAAATMDTGSAGGMQMDPAMMRRHADESDSAVVVMRQHVQEMRSLSPEEQHARVSEHTGRVAAMLTLLERHMREMDMGMNMSDEHMGAMMGKDAEGHRHMINEMQTLRAEAEALQIASPADVARQMPPHLERLEALLTSMEVSGAHMRRSGSGQGGGD